MKSYLQNRLKSNKFYNSVIASTSNDAVTNESANAASLFLRLPGELRINIYSHALFPGNDIFIINATEPQDIFATVLRSPLLKVSRQIRKEVIAFLCSTKHITIVDIHPANVFFRCIGPIGLANLANLSLIMLSNHTILPTTHDDFFAALHEAKALKRLHLEVGSNLYDVVGFLAQESAGSSILNFLRELKKFVKEREEQGLVFECRNRRCDLRPHTPLNAFERRERILREIFGKQKKADK